MDDTTGFRGLLAAVIIQAANDYRDDKYRQEAQAFFLSDGFTWLWETLTDDVAGMPQVRAARQRVFMGQTMIGRKAYHAQWAA